MLKGRPSRSNGHHALFSALFRTTENAPMTRPQNAETRHLLSRLRTSPNSRAGSSAALSPNPVRRPSAQPDALSAEELERLFPFLKPLRTSADRNSLLSPVSASASALLSARSVTDFDELLFNGDGQLVSEQEEDNETWKWGLALLILSGFVFVMGLYAAVFSPFVEKTGIPVGLRWSRSSDNACWGGEA